MQGVPGGGGARVGRPQGQRARREQVGGRVGGGGPGGPGRGRGRRGVGPARANTLEGDAGIERLTALDAAWGVTGHGPRLRAIREAARALREVFRAGPDAAAVRTLPRTTLAYPARFAFWGWERSPAPFISMTHRTLLVQFVQGGERKTLLFNPTDTAGSRRTPYFAKMIDELGAASKLFARESDPIEAQLEALGLSCDAVDYLASGSYTQLMPPANESG